MRKILKCAFMIVLIVPVLLLSVPGTCPAETRVTVTFAVGGVTIGGAALWFLFSYSSDLVPGLRAGDTALLTLSQGDIRWGLPLPEGAPDLRSGPEIGERTPFSLELFRWNF